VPNKTYYFHVFFDGNEMSAFNSWKYVFPFKVKRVDFSSRRFKSTFFKPSLLQSKSNQKEEPYSINFYNLSGVKIMTKEVHNIEEENKISLLRPKGVYIIKSKKGDRKVYVD